MMYYVKRPLIYGSGNSLPEIGEYKKNSTGNKKICFCFLSTDYETGEAVTGIKYMITGPGYIATGTSDCDGKVYFYLVRGYEYILKSLKPPPGYAHNDWRYEIVYDMDRDLYVDGIKTEKLTIENIRITENKI